MGQEASLLPPASSPTSAVQGLRSRPRRRPPQRRRLPQRRRRPPQGLVRPRTQGRQGQGSTVPPYRLAGEEVGPASRRTGRRRPMAEGSDSLPRYLCRNRESSRVLSNTAWPRLKLTSLFVVCARRTTTSGSASTRQRSSPRAEDARRSGTSARSPRYDFSIPLLT